MVNNNYIREDGNYKVIKADNPNNKLLINQILYDDYSDITHSMEKESFGITFTEKCDLFKEIVYDKKVVGFSTYKSNTQNDCPSTLQYIYILPEYRGKGLFIEDINEMHQKLQSIISIEFPNGYIVKSLINHGLTMKLNEEIIISRVPFIVPVSQNPFEDDIFARPSIIYDLNLSAVVCLSRDSSMKMYVPMDPTTSIYEDSLISETIDVDVRDFKSLEHRLSSDKLNDGTYFEYINKLYSEYEEEIDEWLSREGIL